jgi:hypothetical protein
VQEILGFYRRYHSMRYVRKNLVLRMQELLHPQLLDEINLHFADILQDGRIVQRHALPEEEDEPQLAAMPRLVLHFNRRSLGRLRQLIDCINRGSVEP